MFQAFGARAIFLPGADLGLIQTQVLLADLSGRINLAFIFGSLAVGQQKYSSDVDLMVIGDISLLEAVKALAEHETDAAAERLFEQLQSWLINNRDDLVL